MNLGTPQKTEAPHAPPPVTPNHAAGTRPVVSDRFRDRPGVLARDPFISSTLDETSNWGRFVFSLGLHFLGLILLAGVPIIAVHEIAVRRSNQIVIFKEPAPVEEPLPPRAPSRLAAPRRSPAPPLPTPEARPLVQEKLPEPEVLRPPIPEPLRPEPVREEPRPVRVVRPALETLVPVAAPPARPKVRTEVFSEPEGAAPVANLPARNVQTGGFGDPDGTHRDLHSRRPGNLPEIGSFDLAIGPGQGNGSGGLSGVRGAVASAGFGSEVASDPGASHGVRKGAVNAGGFGDGRAQAEPVRPRPQPTASPIVAMEILSKPRPVYTDEARRLRLEGEVVLEVLFGASGTLRVLRVARGLGHGLDEAAIKAAEMIRFSPARRDNQPVDYTATVRMVFQLAY